MTTSVGDPSPNGSPTGIIPYLTIGEIRGLSDNTTLVYDVHLLTAALGVAGVDVGAAHRLHAQSGSAPEITALGQAYLFAGSGGARAFPHASVNASWRRGDRQLLYIGADAVAQFQGRPALFATPLIGWQFPAGKRLALETEFKWTAANRNTAHGIFEGVADRRRPWRARLSARRYLGEKPMNRRLMLAALSIGALSGCKLDSFLFSPVALTSYVVADSVIADSLRTIVPFKSDNETLYGMLARQPGSAPRRTVLYSHGNDQNIPDYWDRVEYLWKAGYDVFIYDYRGYGMSTGTSKDETTLFTDARAALATVLAMPGVTPASLILYGFSLGGAPTIELAANSVTARVVITESAFTSGESLAQSGTLLDIPGGYVLKGKFDNLGKAPRITVPWLIMHGSADPKIDVSAAHALFAAAGGPKRLMIVDGATHSGIPTTMGTAAYIAFVRDFIENPPQS